MSLSFLRVDKDQQSQQQGKIFLGTHSLLSVLSKEKIKNHKKQNEGITIDSNRHSTHIQIFRILHRIKNIYFELQGLFVIMIIYLIHLYYLRLLHFCSSSAFAASLYSHKHQVQVSFLPIFALLRCDLYQTDLGYQSLRLNRLSVCKSMNRLISTSNHVLSLRQSYAKIDLKHFCQSDL